MSTVTSAHAAHLARLAHGRVLEYGYGIGRSARAMASSERVESVLSWEPDPRFIPDVMPAKTLVVGGDQPVEGDFDFVFLDHFTRDGRDMDRAQAALYWHSRGAQVVVDDAGLVPLDAEPLDGMWVLA